MSAAPTREPVRGVPQATGPRVLLRVRPTRWFIVLHRGGWMLGLLAAAWTARLAAGFAPDARGGAAMLNVGWVCVVWVVALLAVNIVDRACRAYVLTETHVLRRSGILRRAEVEVALDRIQSLTVVRSIRERVVGAGTIAFATAGSDGFEFTWYMAASPESATAVLRQAIAARVER